MTAPGAHQPARSAGPFFRVDFLFHLDTCCLLGFYVPGVKGRRPWAPPCVCGGACAGCRSEWGPRGGDPSPAPSAQLLRSLSFFPFLGQTQFLKSLCVCALGSSYVWSSAVSAVPNHSQPVAPPLCPGLRSPRRGCPPGTLGGFVSFAVEMRREPACVSALRGVPGPSVGRVSGLRQPISVLRALSHKTHGTEKKKKKLHFFFQMGGLQMKQTTFPFSQRRDRRF